uniref:Uncharacterized protein n=1 Tax=Panagrolaimus sp. ES5 TaxID=591445 RepID=A0AC34GF85_9BILA
MDELHEFILSDLYKKLALSDDEFEQYLMELKLLNHFRTCICGNKMIKRVKPNGAETHRCTTRLCRKEKGFLVATFFEGSHLSLKE